jgi:hypothetical protein
MLEIEWVEGQKPLETLTYLVPGTRKHALDIYRQLEEHELPIYDCYCPDLPEVLDGLIVCSDLQGHVETKDGLILLGEWLPGFLSAFLSLHFPTIDPKLTGICLCGDMHANIEKRGGAGDVRGVWEAFRETFRWVAGVAGNHDEFGNKAEFEAFKRLDNIHFLDGQIFEIDGLEIGGVSGIIGDKKKPFRVPEALYFKALDKVLAKRPQIMLLHESPDAEGSHGNPDIRDSLERAGATLLFCGHSHWRKVSARYANGTLVMNMDARVLLLHKFEPSPLS